MNWLLVFNVIYNIINTALILYQKAKVKEIHKDDIKEFVFKSAEFIALVTGKDAHYVTMIPEIVDDLVTIVVKVYNLSGRWTEEVTLDLPEDTTI